MKRFNTAALAGACMTSLICTAAYAVSEQWQITGLSVSPAPTHKNEFNQMGYFEGEKITVTCSYKQVVAGDAKQPAAVLSISDNGVVQDTIGITAWQGGTRSVSYAVQGKNVHNIKCAVSTLYAGKGPQSILNDEKTQSIFVIAQKIQEGGAWPSSPSQKKPGTPPNQKPIKDPLPPPDSQRQGR